MGLQILSFMEFAGNALGGYLILLQLVTYLKNWSKDLDCVILGMKLTVASWTIVGY
jgi:hypothetical protein